MSDPTIEIGQDDHIYVDGRQVAELIGCDENSDEAYVEAEKRFRTLVAGTPGLISSLKLQRKCCCEALDGTWDPSGEGMGEFNNMVELIDSALRAAGIDPDPAEATS